MDDVRWQIIPEDRRPEAEERLLKHLGKTRAFLFAIGQGVDNLHGSSILKRWSAAGHCIGNHTYSHQPLFGKITPEEFEADILRNEDVLRRYSGFRKSFRFPLLKEGQTRELRDRFAVERLAQMTDFESDEALARFEAILAKLGVEKRLRELGVHEGDTVRIAGVEFDYS